MSSSGFQPGNAHGRHANHKGGRPKRFDEQELTALFDASFSVKDRKAVIRKQVEKALAGDLEAGRWLFDRCYGRPKVQVEQTGTVALEYASSWADVEEECLRLGIDPELARLEAKRLIESAEHLDDEEEEGE